MGRENKTHQNEMNFATGIWTKIQVRNTSWHLILQLHLLACSFQHSFSWFPHKSDYWRFWWHVSTFLTLLIPQKLHAFQLVKNVCKNHLLDIRLMIALTQTQFEMHRKEEPSNFIYSCVTKPPAVSLINKHQRQEIVLMMNQLCIHSDLPTTLKIMLLAFSSYAAV